VSRLRRLEPVDVLALFALVLIAVGVSLRVGVDVALIVVGALLLAYAVLVSRSEQPEQEVST
jgi:cyanate permease